MRVLGLDPGSRRTGWGVVERNGNRFTAIAHGTAAPRPKLDLPERLHDIATKIGEVIERTSPAAAAVEEAFYHESVRSTLVLGHVRGALLVTCVGRGLSIAEYSPREIKLSVVGTGGASKDQVAFMVRRMLGLKGDVSSDAADALATALCHLHHLKLSPPARAASVAAERLQDLLTRRGAR